MKGRTVLVLPAWYPTARQPLAGPFVRDHARAAAAYGHHIVVVADEGARADIRGLFQLRTETDGHLTVVRFTAKPGWGRLVHLPALAIITRRLARKGARVEVIHAHIHWMGWVAVLLGTFLRRPVVITENSSEWPTHTMSRSGLRRARIAFRRAALVCPVNQQLQDAIESYRVRARFRIVPNAVDTETFHPGPTRRRDAPTRLINVALHVEIKRLDVLLRAFAKVLASRPDLTLDLVGEGPLTADLRKLAATLGIDEHVRFRGIATPGEVATALRESDVFVFASLSENLPLGVLEALCCGLPVAATNVGGIPEAVGPDGALAPPDDVDALAAAIEDVLERYPSFDRIEIAARAAARYSFQAVGGTWDEIYRSLCAGAGAHSSALGPEDSA